MAFANVNLFFSSEQVRSSFDVIKVNTVILRSSVFMI